MLARPVVQPVCRALHIAAADGTVTVVARGCTQTSLLSGKHNGATKPLQVTVLHAGRLCRF